MTSEYFTIKEKKFILIKKIIQDSF